MVISNLHGSFHGKVCNFAGGSSIKVPCLGLVFCNDPLNKFPWEPSGFFGRSGGEDCVQTNRSTLDWPRLLEVLQER